MLEAKVWSQDLVGQRDACGRPASQESGATPTQVLDSRDAGAQKAPLFPLITGGANANKVVQGRRMLCTTFDARDYVLESQARLFRPGLAAGGFALLLFGLDPFPL